MINIAIDGPSGSGKSTVAKIISYLKTLKVYTNCFTKSEQKSRIIIEVKHMKKIAFYTPNYSLPVPAVGGGAVEELIEILIDENEKNNKSEYVIFQPVPTKEQKLAIEKYNYKNTKVDHSPRSALRLESHAAYMECYQRYPLRTIRQPAPDR